MFNRFTIVGLGAVIILGLSTALFAFLILSSLLEEKSAVQEELSLEIGVTEETKTDTPTTTNSLPETPPLTYTWETPTIELIELTPIPTRTAELSAIESRQSRTDPTITPRDRAITHIVEDGENLYSIAAGYGISLEAIMAANDLADPRVIFTGQLLLIPLAGSPIQIQAAADKPALPSLTSESNPTLTNVAEAREPAPPVALPAADTAPAQPPTLTSLPPTAPVPGTPTPLPDPIFTVNGLAIDQFIKMSEEAKQHAHEIFALGQQLGRNPRAFSKVGDSTIENPHFLARFDSSPYNLGPYWYLQPTIDYFAGSFGRQGNAVRRGLHSWTVTDPTWADKTVCQPNESPIACEIRLHNPAILLIRLGSNDSGVPAGFNQNVRQVVEYTISQGVIPIIGTKADRFEGEDNINNILLRQIAADYRLLLWDFDLIAGTIPGRGLDTDDVHLTFYYAHDYTSPVAYQRGHSIHNLTALMVLELIRNEVIQAGG